MEIFLLKMKSIIIPYKQQEVYINLKIKRGYQMSDNFNTHNFVQDHIYRVDCPFKGKGKIVVKKDDHGRSLGKCELAEIIWSTCREASFIGKIKANRYMKSSEFQKEIHEICPGFPYRTLFGGLKKVCKYGLGDWVEV